MARRKSSTFVLRQFKCPVCGQRMSAPKRIDTGPEHLKDMYCPGCRCERTFEQYDSDHARAV